MFLNASKKLFLSSGRQQRSKLWDPHGQIFFYPQGIHIIVCLLTDSDIDIAIFGVHSLNYNETNNTVDPGTPSVVECLYKLARNLEKIACKDSVQVFNTAKVCVFFCSASNR